MKYPKCLKHFWGKWERKNGSVDGAPIIILVRKCRWCPAQQLGTEK